MNLTLQDLNIIYSEQLFIPLSEQEKQELWQQTKQQNYHNSTVNYNDYLNRLSNLLLPYIKAELNSQLNPKIWLEEKELPKIWQGLNGTAIDLNQTRLVLIPSEDSDFSQLKIPREWIDLPDFVGNYYLALQINIEEGWIQVLGYTTHQQIKEKGYYNFLDETYSLDVEELSEDLTAMYVAIELYSNPKPSVKFSSSLSNKEAENLINQLSLNKFTLPRLDIPFSQWGELINNPQWRNRLYEKTHLVSKLNTQQIEVKSSNEHNEITNLLEWFKNNLTETWQNLDSLINPNSLNLAYSLRSGNHEQNINVERVKLIDLGIALGNESVALLVSLTQEEDNKISIRIQLHPAGNLTFLPPNIKLMMLSKSGKIIQETQARNQDNAIQLKKFTTTIDKQFAIKIALNEFSITENFVLTQD